MRVLVIEDEPTLAEVIGDNLLAEGYQVEVASDGHEGLLLWRETPPDLVVLDVMLPKLDGYTLCRQMRASGDQTPVLFLSAKGQAEDRVRGLSVGGDDYLAKPFHLPEFLLRVRSMLRRRSWLPDQPFQLSFGGHSVDFRRWTATLASGRVEILAERELAILRLLAERQNEVVSRDDILDRVWRDDSFPSSRTIDNFILRLRKLFEPDPSHPVYFHTVWGVGYRFTPEGQPVATKV